MLNIIKNSQRMLDIMHFFDWYNLKEINFHHAKKGWTNFGSNNKTIAFNIVFVPYNSDEIRHAYIEKHISVRENEVILLIITDSKNKHYLVAKRFSALCRERNNGYSVVVYLKKKINLNSMKMYVKIIIIATKKFLKKKVL